jgi:hypothetical protein
VPLTRWSRWGIYAGCGATGRRCPPTGFDGTVVGGHRLRIDAPVPSRLQNLSTNRVDSRGLTRTREDAPTTRKPKDLRTLATKDERHRQLGKVRSLGFKSSRPDYFSGRSPGTWRSRPPRSPKIGRPSRRLSRWVASCRAAGVRLQRWARTALIAVRGRGFANGALERGSRPAP